MKITTAIVIGLTYSAVILLAACSHSEGPPAAPSPAVSSTTSPAAAGPTGTEDGARETASAFLKTGADLVALTRKLQPADGDYDAVFEGPAAATARTYYVAMWQQMKGGIGPKPGQSEVVLASATTADLKSGRGKAREFAGGWKRASTHLKDGLTFYKFSFVEPGKSLGMTFDGLVWVNGHWVIFPKPWRAF